VVRLLEREDGLGVLLDVVQDAVAGRGSVVLVAGEAGIGKSSLLRRLRERTDEGVTFLIGACEPLSVPVPLAPIRELVEAAGGGDLIDVGSDDRLVLVRRVASVLDELAPVVAVIEDVHWADEATLDLLSRALSPRLPGSGTAAGAPRGLGGGSWLCSYTCPTKTTSWPGSTQRSGGR
jgi:predicted ATPase